MTLRPGTQSSWWREGVVYQIYPRSFADTNGDGVGDLPGIIEHLDHLAGGDGGLGVDAIWLSPIYPSPGLDGGYDVSDHSAIDPLFGTMADFDRLLEEAHRRGLKVILDLVLNHTSDRHAWFVDSRSSRDNGHADWYIWRDPAGFDRRGRPRPPNNWVSFFGGSAWQWEPAREQFYLHTFLVEQPEVNWRSPDLRQAQFDVVRAWLGRGVDGFRLDVFNAFLKSESFASNPRRWRLARAPWDRQRHINDKDQPDFPDLLREFRANLDAAPGRMSVGEMFSGALAKAAEYTVGSHLVFDFGLIETPWSADAMGHEIDRREAAFGPDRWPAAVLSNHDRSRHVSRFLRRLPRHDAATADRLARAAAVLLLTLRGTPFLYYGEEIGLPDVAVPREAIVDPPARRASFFFPWWNRDQCRSPMAWNGGPNGGFTTGRPWLPLIPNPGERNVAAQAAEDGSVLRSYERLLAVRRASPALRSGSFARVASGDRDVLAYVREAGGERALVAINFAAEPHRCALPAGAWRPLFDTDRPVGIGPVGIVPDGRLPDAPGDSIELAGLQALILAEGAS
jgi:alpha-glucosidase